MQSKVFLKGEKLLITRMGKRNALKFIEEWIAKNKQIIGCRNTEAFLAIVGKRFFLSYFHLDIL